jgi:4-amino-4-deoxy-L-arabinose transferase-like glycosyltransferase
LLLYLALRIPSWFEPHWYSDEAGYMTTAWLSTHGSTLYLTVWNNKPPLIFWIYDVAIWLFGPSEFGIHLLSTLTGLAALAVLWRLLRTRYRGKRVLLAMGGAALFLGLPLFNGELALPENFLIAPEAAAMLCLLWSLTSHRPKPALFAAAFSGVLFGLACLIQQTSLGPAALAVLLLLVVRGRRGLPQVGAMLTGLVVVVLAGIAPYLIWAGPHNVYYFLVQSYQEYTSSTLPLTPLMLLPRVAAGLLLVAGLYWRRHDEPVRLLAVAWLVCELLVYALPNRPYAHFLLPAVVPACLLLAGARWPDPRHWPWRRLSRPVLPAALGVVVGIWVILIAVSPQSDASVVLTAQYYPAFVGMATGSISTAQYDGLYGTGTVAEAKAVSWIKRNHLQGVTALAWADDAWPYLLASLAPVVPTPAIYMDQTWLGNEGLERLVEKARPDLIYLNHPAAELAGWLVPYLKSDYRQVESGPGQSSLWVRRGV